MNRLLCLVLGLALSAAVAAQSLEIIPLRHRTVEQLVPLLKPLLHPGGVLTGQNSQLIVRTTPANLAELREAVRALDRPLRRLEILVRFEGAAAADGRGADARARIGGPRPGIEARAHELSSRIEDRVDQRIQVLEGGRAVIASGEARPLRERTVVRTPGGIVTSDTVTLQEAATGFAVVPRLAGQRVELEVTPQQESLGPAGRVESRRLATTVAGNLGEWIEVGGAATGEARGSSGLASVARSSRSEDRRIWVKVEEISD